MKLFLSALAEKKLEILLEYLENDWGTDAKEDFFEMLQDELEILVKNPFKCPPTLTFSNLHKCTITKQTSIIYRVNTDVQEIEIISIIDNRQDPEKINKEIMKYFGKQ